MISNTIGLTVLEDDRAECSGGTPAERKIKSTAFYWNSDATGEPLPILTIPPLPQCSAEQQRLWPIGGVSIVLPSSASIASGSSSSTSGGAAAPLDPSAVRLALVVDAVCLPISGMSGENLAFDDYDTVLMLIENPYEPAHSWRYTHKLFPNLKSGQLKG